MADHSPLIATIVAGLVVAFLMGALAHRLRVPPIAGYLLAGVIVGPFTPGFVAHAGLANQLAEIGVILLMFGVGLHFSLRDLLSVKKIAVPGAIVQIVVATLMGMGLAHAMRWTLAAGMIFGLALSVASTVVLLRGLQVRNLVQTERGRIAVGWLIVEDLVMVLALVLLPALADIENSNGKGGASAILVPLGATLVKVAGFLGLMLVVGRRIIPSALHWVAHTGSRELFRLAVLSIALGVAFGAAYLFDVSFALGAFFAGMILGETQLSRRATEDTLPLRDAFAVLFFVSVGMLFDPAVVIEQPLPLLATIAIIMLGKSLAAFVIVRSFGYGNTQALTIAASLAQIGEFSFILAALGTGLGVLPSEARDLILAGAIISIFLNPFIFTLIVALPDKDVAERAAAPVAPKRHSILIGYGRVGRLVALELKRLGRSFAVIEVQHDIVQQAEADGIACLDDNALDSRMLEAAGIGEASHLLLAVPEGFEAVAICERVQALNPHVHIIARVHSDDDVDHFTRIGVAHVIVGEREIAGRIVALSA